MFCRETLDPERLCTQTIRWHKHTPKPAQEPGPRGGGHMSTRTLGSLLERWTATTINDITPSVGGLNVLADLRR